MILSPPEGLACNRWTVMTADYWQSRQGQLDALFDEIIADNYPSAEANAFLGYAVKVPKKDSVGQAIAGNEVPKDWVVTVDDVHLNGDADDPENFVVRKSRSLLAPAGVNAGIAPEDPDWHYVRYAAGPAKQSVAPAVDGKFARPAKHIARTWELQNEFGSLRVVSKKVSALLVPALADASQAPANTPDYTHFVCYQVKPTTDVTDQTPDGGRGLGKFRRDLQAFAGDSFGATDCGVLAGGATARFAGTAVEGKCLYDLKKPVELCNPVAVSAVTGGQTTSAAGIDGSVPGTTKSRLCYKVALAKSLANETSAALAGGTVGEKLDEKQQKHVPRLGVYAEPRDGFPAPHQFDTKKVETLCVPTDVVTVTAK